jgi:hypothetical protein
MTYAFGRLRRHITATNGATVCNWTYNDIGEPLAESYTAGLLSNDEVLALDQDALGRQAVRAAAIGQVDVFAKELEDGSTALGFFNRGDDVAKINFNKLGYIGLSGGFHVRDLWRQTDLPDVKSALKLAVPPQGVVLLKLTRARHNTALAGHSSWETL